MTMTIHHMCEDIAADPDGFWIGECNCGYTTAPSPSLDIAIDQLMQHAADQARKESP